MRKIRIAAFAGGAFALTLAGLLVAGQGRVAVAGDAAFEDRIRLLRTAPGATVTSHEERERNYRSCLFTFLPQIGSDAAAEMLREACRDEYLRTEG